MKPHRLALIGSGHRGIHLRGKMPADSARAELVAVAEPRPERRDDCLRAFPLPPEHAYLDHQELLGHATELGIDAIVIATMADTHHVVARACIEAGLPIFLEKPITRTFDEALDLVQFAEDSGARVQVGFNMRYMPFCQTLHDIVDSEVLGTILSINWTEAISLRHWTEGYSRNPSYNSTAKVGSWLLEKTCHDLDLFNWLLDKRCQRVASFGSRSFFRPRPDVPKRCTDGCPIIDECLFAYVPEAADMSAYLQPEELDACIYHVDADIVDHQTAIFEFEGGTTISFTLVPLAPEESRSMTFHGTEATLTGSMAAGRIVVDSLRTGEQTVHTISAAHEAHHGADEPTATAFLDYLDDPANLPRTGLDEGLEAVMMAHAADRAAQEHCVVELEPLRRKGTS